MWKTYTCPQSILVIIFLLGTMTCLHFQAMEALFELSVTGSFVYDVGLVLLWAGCLIWKGLSLRQSKIVWLKQFFYCKLLRRILDKHHCKMSQAFELLKLLLSLLWTLTIIQNIRGEPYPLWIMSQIDWQFSLLCHYTPLWNLICANKVIKFRLGTEVWIVLIWLVWGYLET